MGGCRRWKGMGLLALVLVVVGSWLGPVQAAWADVQAVAASDQRSIGFSDGWRFNVWLNAGANKRAYNESDADLAASAYNDASWRTVDVPHDWSIEQDFTSEVSVEQGALPTGIGWYRKHFTLPQQDAGGRINLEFDGVFQNATIYVNGRQVGVNPNGYAPFSFDVTDYVTADGATENVVAVKVDASSKKGSRWYSGAGIYRNVRLTVTDPVHVAHWGTAIWSPDIAKKAGKGDITLNNRVTVKNQGKAAAKVQVRTTLLGYKTDKQVEGVKPSTTEAVELAAGAKQDLTGALIVANPKLWSPDSPNLYTVKTEILVDGKVVDTYTDRFGFKWSAFTANDGFELNGSRIKLQGVSMHHDQGALGAAAWEDSVYRQMRIMKEMGVNAVRVTHNPADPALIKACDELGLMVVEEAYDGWASSKSGGEAYAKTFKQVSTNPDADGMTWGEFDYANMIRKDRNRPSIIAWSIGNEVFDGGTWAIGWVTKAAQEITPAEDPAGRVATIGDNKFKRSYPSSSSDRVSMQKAVGAQGFNYSEERYDQIHKDYPTWAIYGSETASAVASRGWYSDPQKQTGAQYIKEYNLSSYDNLSVNWGRTATDSLIPDRDRKWVAGQFVWTGFDYIGEPSPFGSKGGSATGGPKSSFFGIVDTAGFAKDSYYLYQSQWLSVDEHPMVHILPHWNWQDDSLRKLVETDGKIPVRTYSNAPKVELFRVSADGKEESLGEKSFYQKTTDYGVTYQQQSKDSDRLYLEWKVDWKYEPGTKLVAVAKDKDGNEIARDEVVTAAEAAKVSLKAEKNYIKANGTSLSYIEADIQDKDGNFVPTADNEITFSITGNGKIVGVDNGDAASWERYKDTNGVWKRAAYSGKALVIVQSTGGEGSFTVSATASGLKADTALVATTNEEVKDDTVLGYKAASLTVETGTKLADVKLPARVEAVRADGKETAVDVAWDELTQADLDEPGVITLSGEIDGKKAVASLTLTVRSLAGVRPVTVATYPGYAPELPSKVEVVWTDGTTEKKDVDWDEVDAGKYVAAGTFIVEGVVKDIKQKATVQVRVTNTLGAEGSLAQSANGGSVTGSSENSKNADHLIDGKWGSSTPWQVTGTGAQNETGSGWVSLKLGTPAVVSRATFVNATKGSSLPTNISIKYKDANGDWQDVKNPSSTSGPTEYSKAKEITFDAVYASELRFELKKDGWYTFGVSEIEVFGKPLALNGAAVLQDLALDGRTIEGFAAGTTSYTHELAWDAKLPVVTATGANGATVLVRPAVRGAEVATVEVTSENGRATAAYTVTFTRAAVPLKTVEVTSDLAKVTEDDTVELAVKATLADGSAAKQDSYTVSYAVTDGTGHAEVRDGKLYVYDAGTVTLVATVERNGEKVSSAPINIDIAKNPEKKTFKGFEPVTVKTVPGKAPELPATVTATYSTGLPRTLAVAWDAVASESYAKIGRFTVKGAVEGIDERAIATVDVVGPIAAQNVALTVPEGYPVHLPATVTVYNSDGTTSEQAVTWGEQPESEKDGIAVYRGAVGSTGLIATATVRTASKDETERPNENYGLKYNGWGLPDGLASFTNDTVVNAKATDSATYLNDGTADAISGSNKKIWTNFVPSTVDPNKTQHTTDWAGVTLAEGGQITARTADEVDFWVVDEGQAAAKTTKIPAGYKVQYYKAEAPDFGKMLTENDSYSQSTGVGNGGQMADAKLWPNNPLSDDANWADVEYVDADGTVTDKAPELPEHKNDGKTVAHKVATKFKPVETRMFRIVFTGQQDSAVGVSEIEVWGSSAIAQTEVQGAKVMVDGKDVTGEFDRDGKLEMEIEAEAAFPRVTATASSNAAITVIPATDSNPTATVSFVPEGGGAGTKTFTITFNRKGAPQPPVTVTHTVTFQTNGGSAVETQKVESGKAASKPADPAREGYTFDGWYADEALKQAYDFGAPVTHDVTLWAKWTKKDDGGSSQKPDGDQGGEQKPGSNNAGNQSKPDGGNEGSLPQTGDSSVVYVVGAAGTGILAIAAAFFLCRKNG